MPSRPAGAATAAVLLLVLSAAGCTSSVSSTAAPAPGAAVSAASAPPQTGGSGSIRLYTSATQATVDALVKVFAAARPGVAVDVFRAPTAQLNARIAAERASGGLTADVLWLTDPLSMDQFARQGLLLRWSPSAPVPAAYRTDSCEGTRLLNLVLVVRNGTMPEPRDWADLASTGLQGAVAIPDPAFAGAALGALAWLSGAPGLGMDFYRRLRANGAVQVSSPDDVVTGTAQGVYKAGLAIDQSVATAVAKGSPVHLVWPASGAIAVYSPIAVIASSKSADNAKAFVDAVLSPAGQAAILASGWEPVVAGTPGWKGAAGPQVSPDWSGLGAMKDQLLAQYHAIFGG